MDEQSVSLFVKLLAGTDDGLSSGPLHECLGLLIHWRTQKIVGAGIADIELDSRVEGSKFDQVGLFEHARFFGRLRS